MEHTKEKTACDLSNIMKTKCLRGKKSGSSNFSLILGRSMIALRRDDRMAASNEMMSRVDRAIKSGSVAKAMAIVYEYIVPIK